MFNSIRKFFGTLDQRIKVLFVFIGIHTWHQRLSLQYNQLYATELGATPVALGSINSISSIAGSLITIPSGWAADRYGLKRVLLLGLGLIALVSGLYSFATSWEILIFALFFFGASGMLIMPLVDIIFINYAKQSQRSIVMSLSRTLWAIPSIFAPLIAAALVTYFGGINVAGIRPLYYIQLGFALLVFISLLLWLRIPKKAPIERSQPARTGKGFIQDFRDLFKGEIGLKRWLTIMTSRNIGLSLAMPFIPLWLVHEKGADPYILGLIGTIGAIVLMLLQIPVGKLADKIGRKRAFYLFRPFAFLGTLVLILAPQPKYLLLVGLLGCFGFQQLGLSEVSFIPFITMNHEMVSREKRGRWHGSIGLFRLISFPASILGGIIWQQGLMIEVLLLPIALELLIVFPLMMTIPDTLYRRSL